MLKRLRITFSVVLVSLITLYFLDFRGWLPDWLSFLGKIQLIPALLALNVIVLAGLSILTFLFGRIYCSSVCPMGIYQDAVAWISKKVKRKKRYHYSKAKTYLRWGVLAATAVAFLFGFTFLLGLLDPYGAYGRITTHLFRPAYLAGNNLLAAIFSSFHNYTFYKVSIYGLSLFSTAIALTTFAVIGYLAWKNGRTWCNTICPVGTALGFLSRFSLFKIRFNNEKCNQCGLCAMKCKASCIDPATLQVDHSRCVACFNCLESCHREALAFTPKPIWLFRKSESVSESPAVSPFDTRNLRPANHQKIPADAARRRFLAASLATGATAFGLMAQKTLPDNVHSKKNFRRQTPVAPPGTPSIAHLNEKCVACHLCVSKCPSHVIEPALLDYGPAGVMQPKLAFDKGFCNYDCTICGEVCPTGAIMPLSKEEKNHTQAGQVQFIMGNCIVYYDETSCGACSEHCPTQAVHMVPYKGLLTIPEVRPEICVGCGACEHVCPAIPFKAIYVEGLASQRRITMEKEKTEEIEIDDFGF